MKVDNFKSINNDDQSSGLHNGMVCHTATNIFNKKNLSPASSLNKNSIVNQHSQVITLLIVYSSSMLKNSKYLIFQTIFF